LPARLGWFGDFVKRRAAVHAGIFARNVLVTTDNFIENKKSRIVECGFYKEFNETGG
jgi:hypothetical protein